ncbi:hypothetical protein BGZ61DRAFT_532441 [Ilyonectria robusta]|uniref:uncharacterized protein n=1 Tax=Ilyonectria robusta TaxID=1079257 RepID=UPI001E8CC608|nr:uncharacterized protein BGZ61DRAFT_532441 [Ilyonectria robusta]KAH8694346.1 hypothetical protein BGZ61DRAFT_532441 [Ilyonectria robusta]
MLKPDDEEDDLERQDCEYILNLAELLVRSGGSEAHPIFTWHADLIPPLYLVGLSSGDADIQQRTTTLLRSMRRREGIWDSQEVAEILETMHLAAKQDLLASDMIPCGITQLAKMLSDLRLPSLSAANGALLLPLPDVDK